MFLNVQFIFEVLSFLPLPPVSNLYAMSGTQHVFLVLKSDMGTYTHTQPVSSRPMLELCIPSSLDPTLAPLGCHVMSIFSQYTPYKLNGERWTEEKREEYANHGKNLKPYGFPFFF